jgi:primosomal protein N' (replication factor Y)
LPIPLQNAFTYSIHKEESDFLRPGMRIAVPFGKSKVYTGMVYKLHQNEPTAYQAKEIYQILDDSPLLTSKQISHWEWLAEYYMCTLGEVMRAALPNAFLLESESVIAKREGFDQLEDLTAEEEMVWEALGYRDKIKVQELGGFLEPKRVLPIVQAMLKKEAIDISDEIYQKYRPKMVKYLRLSEQYEKEDRLHGLLDQLSRAEKQRQALMVYFKVQAGKNKPLLMRSFQEEEGVSPAALRSLVQKGVFEVEEVQQDRVSFVTQKDNLKPLSEVQ